MKKYSNFFLKLIIIIGLLNLIFWHLTKTQAKDIISTLQKDEMFFLSPKKDFFTMNSIAHNDIIGYTPKNEEENNKGCSSFDESLIFERSFGTNLSDDSIHKNVIAPIFATDTLVHPLTKKAIVVRGNKRHPCINFTSKDLQETRERVKRYDWAKKEYKSIIKAADIWMKDSNQYWLSFLPEQGAAYAYGFAGCPICGSPTGTWDKAFCSWDNPGHVNCKKGHILPDAEHPDNGKGYVSSDGRTYYFAGQFNAWVTEQWTINAIPVLAQAYLLTGDERYAERGLLLLDALASIYKETTSGSWDYPAPHLSGRLARPLYQVARTLVIFADSYDWLYNSPGVEKASLRPGMNRRKNIEQYLLLDGAYYCYSKSWKGSLTNGHADYLRGTLAVGCLLDIPEYIDAAINGPFSINVMLANNIDRDGMYYEGALGYSMHARNLYLTYADPLSNLRNKEYPNGYNIYDDPRMQAALTLPDLRFQLAGRRPNYGDCIPEVSYLLPPRRLFKSIDYEFTERLFAKTTDPAKQLEYGQILNYLANDSLNELRGKNFFGWLFWHAKESVSAGGKLPPDLMREVNDSWVAGVKGAALLRKNDQAALLRYGPSIYHGDYDDLGLIYNANGYELSYEIGYGLSTTHTQVGWASSTVSHALVTVNEQNQLQGDGGGGSLLGFAALPSVQFVDANSPLSYSKENVHEYRRALALVSAGYLVDFFHVEGGNRHDYGFGSLGTSLEPFGVQDLKQMQGSLAEGYDWGRNIGNDGDIKGYANKPAWNPPPGNGYGFFFDVQKAKPTNKTWGGIWSISDVHQSNAIIPWDNTTEATNEHPTRLRLHLVGDNAEPVFAKAPGLYPSLPLSSYVMARRSGKDLKSTFLAVYEPYVSSSKGPLPRFERVERLGEQAIAVYRTDGKVDLLLFGPHQLKSVYGSIEFKGDFVYITGDGKSPQRAESLGTDFLSVGGRVLIKSKGSLVAKVTRSDVKTCTVELDTDLPATIAGQTAIFSNPAWTRTSAYYIARAEGRKLLLNASTLSLGIGRVRQRLADGTILSDIPHEYAKSFYKSSRFFEGKMVVGRSNGTARITSVKPGSPMKISVETGATLNVGELFEYMDLSPGDNVRIALSQVWTSAKANGKPSAH